MPTRLEVFDSAGRLVRILIAERRDAGRHEETWNGEDGEGKRVASGLYFLRLTTPEFQETRKAVMVPRGTSSKP